jgi:hypothetical protein
MLITYGRAAFLALVTTAALASGASAAPQLPTFACFTPANATLIGRLGPNDASVRHAFDAGACLALPAGIGVSDVAREGNLVRFRTMGGAPPLFAPEWGAGFTGNADPRGVADFSIFLPVTGKLLESGYAFADCYAATERLNARWRVFMQRWNDYERRGATRDSITMTKIVLHMRMRGGPLADEAIAIDNEGRMLDRRCAPYETQVTDRDFVAFVRSIRHAV